MAESAKNRKVRLGEVVSNKMDKTIVVKVERKINHPVFKRIIKKSKKYKAHDAGNQCEVGDKVRIMETRPLSKDKCWRLLEIVEKAQRV
ncbi:MAG: 30S ribosomal protein S17 [Nitrospinae bacterium]|nr:30S ribosomal protein S17 [Nitrospinota bacterium]